MTIVYPDMVAVADISFFLWRLTISVCSTIHAELPPNTLKKLEKITITAKSCVESQERLRYCEYPKVGFGDRNIGLTEQDFIRYFSSNPQCYELVDPRTHTYRILFNTSLKTSEKIFFDFRDRALTMNNYSQTTLSALCHL